MFFVETSTLPPSMHRRLDEHGMCCIQINQTPDQKNVMLSYRIALIFSALEE